MTVNEMEDFSAPTRRSAADRDQALSQQVRVVRPSLDLSAMIGDRHLPHRILKSELLPFIPIN